jgi:hypothetical protein
MNKTIEIAIDAREEASLSNAKLPFQSVSAPTLTQQ